MLSSAQLITKNCISVRN